VIGNDHTVSLAVEAGQLELNVMEPVMAFNILQSIKILGNVVHVFGEKCVQGITANKERCQDMVERSVGIVTALNPYIGYENATQIAQEALDSGRYVIDIVKEKGILKEKEIADILSPKNMTEPVDYFRRNQVKGSLSLKK